MAAHTPSVALHSPLLPPHSRACIFLLSPPPIRSCFNTTAPERFSELTQLCAVALLLLPVAHYMLHLCVPTHRGAHAVANASLGVAQCRVFLCMEV